MSKSLNRIIGAKFVPLSSCNWTLLHAYRVTKNTNWLNLSIVCMNLYLVPQCILLTCMTHCKYCMSSTAVMYTVHTDFMSLWSYFWMNVRMIIESQGWINSAVNVHSYKHYNTHKHVDRALGHCILYRKVTGSCIRLYCMYYIGRELCG